MRKAGDTSADAVRTIRKACEAYARKYIDIQRAQFKRLGVLGDWENPYLTLNKEYEADELRLFADIVEKGFVYRGKKPVYWSIPCRTALAEAEVEYQDHVSQSVFVKFPVVGQRKHVRRDLDDHAVDAAGEPRRRLQRKTSIRPGRRSATKITFYFAVCCPAVAEKCGWTNYTGTAFSRRRSWLEIAISASVSAIAPAKLFAGRFCHERHRHRLRPHRARPRSGRLQSRLAERPADLFAGG